MYSSESDLENARLWEVSNHQSLDKFYADMLQELVQTASLVFEVPIVYISFIEEFRQMLMAKKGIYLTELNRQDSFCHHVVQKKSSLIINDTMNHSHFRLNPLVVHYPNIRFYAGAPVKSKNGHVLGAFCICDTKFRQFSIEEENKLIEFSKQASYLLELNRLALSSKKNKNDIEQIRMDQITINREIFKDSFLTNINFQKNPENEKKQNPIKQFFSETKKSVMSVPKSTLPDISGYKNSKMKEWSNIMHNQFIRKQSRINLQYFMKSLEQNMRFELNLNGNRLHNNFSKDVNWFGDETILKFISMNIICTLNRRLKNSVITFESYGSDDYTMLIARYNSAPLLRYEFDSLFRIIPSEDDPEYKNEIYFSWHAMRFLGGFITVPANEKEGLYIAMGFPNKTAMALSV